MSWWKDIVKINDKGSIAEELEDIADELESLEIEPFSKLDWGDFEHLAYERFPKLDGKLSEEDFKYIDEKFNRLEHAKESYNSALLHLIQGLVDTSDEYKEETNSKKDTNMRQTPSGGMGEVHPAYIDYKLKDDEMWGEPMGDGLMLPVKVDNQYGAEY
jgi:hypothetical protein